MKNVVALFALLFICGAGTVKSQNSTNNFKIFNDKQLLTLNFIEHISFTPEMSINSYLGTSNVKPVKITKTVNTHQPIKKNIEEISATQFKYAMMMDVDVEELTDADLYRFVDEWYGTRYRMGGTTKKGIDCSAFSGTLLSSIYAFSVPRTAREQYKICDRVNKEDLMAGDLVFFNTRGGVSHVGVYLINNRFVHASSSKGIVISSLNDSYYSSRYISGGRVNQ